MSARIVRFASIFPLVLATAAATRAQSNLSCQATASPVIVRAEGVTERMGDIVLQCNNGSPGAIVTGNITVFLSVPMTNRVDNNGFSDLRLTVDTGAGDVPVSAKAIYLNRASLSFSGFTFTVGAPGTAVIRLSNLRGAVNGVGFDSSRQITASLSLNGTSVALTNTTTFTVATAVRSLYSSAPSRLIVTGNVVPVVGRSMIDAISSQAVYSTIRVTEGYPSSFGSQSDPNFQFTDSGTRIIIKYSNVPAGVRLLVPDGIVGYDGAAATSAGDYGNTPSPGLYNPNRQSLLLARVANPDSIGGGRSSGPLFTRPDFAAIFDSMNEVPIGPDGTGMAVFEVVDANPFSVQSATIPTFMDAPYGAVQTPTPINQDVYLGASSASLDTSPNADMPRFSALPPANDCQSVGDCDAGYFPKLAVSSTLYDVNIKRTAPDSPVLTISNTGGGVLFWTANVSYTASSNGTVYSWLKVSQPSGINRGSVRLDFVPGNLADGVYDAFLKIDGGSQVGSLVVHVIMRLAYTAPVPVIFNVVNGASLSGPVVAGSLAAVIGDRLVGKTVTATFDNSPARVVSATTSTRINVQVPADQAGKPSAILVVTVDGAASNPFGVTLADSAPAVYGNFILNADGSVNNPASGALAGTPIVVFATGLPLGGVYSGKIHDRTITGDALVYAGPADGLVGFQQLTMVVPADLPTLLTGVAVCGGLTADSQVCSDFVDLTIVGAAGSAASAAPAPVKKRN